MRHLVEDTDLRSRDVDQILDLARADVGRALLAPGSLVVGLLFLSPSTRTSFGFGAAAARLGGTPISVPTVRATGEGLPPETLQDTLRVIGGMSDVVVCRPPRGVSLAGLAEAMPCPLVCGGDDRSHPTQALVDLHAFEVLAGPSHELHVGVSGDLRARTVRSLLHVLALRPPRRLSLFAPPGREPDLSGMPTELRDRTQLAPEPDFAALDVLYLPGLAPEPDGQPLAPDAHLRWGFSPLSAPSLPSSAVVLSPGPVIDEIDPDCASDARIRVMEQSDLGVAVRTGVLQWTLDRTAVR